MKKIKIKRYMRIKRYLNTKISKKDIQVPKLLKALKIE